MKRVPLRTVEKKWRHCFSHYKPMGIFSDVQGQLTPQSVVQSGQNSNSSELSYNSLLPASMERNGWKTAEKKWRHRFSHDNPICYHGNQWSDLAECRTHQSSLTYYYYLQAWKVPDQEQQRKIGDIVFSIISLWGFFSDVQGQLTPQSVVQSGRNSNSSELSCMSSLPASIKRNGWKTAEKK